MFFDGPLCMFFVTFLLQTAEGLLPRSPGHALAINHRTNTEYAYSYPRRLSRTFTVEMWIRGNAPIIPSRSIFSVAHPKDDNILLIADYVFLLGVFPIVTPRCDTAVWCHIAVTADVSAWPAFDLRTYKDGQFQRNATTTYPQSLNAAYLEEEVLSIVLGQEQDSQLGGFDTTQIFSGHFDEVRIWNCVRTPQEIQASYMTVLPKPYPSSLVSYYTFDQRSWNGSFYEDVANRSLQNRLYVVDYSNATTAPTPPPAYSPPVGRLPALAVSTAPLCAAATEGGRAAVRTTAGRVTVPVSALYCADGGVVIVSVTAVSGGTVILAGGQDALQVPLGSTNVVTFLAANGRVAAGAGFNFTASDGSTTVVGFVDVLNNTAPILSSILALSGDEDTLVAAWIQAVDPDRDIVSLALTAPPTAGNASLDGVVNRTVQYQAPANANGANVGLFTVQAVDSWGALSDPMQVTVSLKPVLDAPSIQMGTNYSIYRGQRIAIPFRAVDVDGNDPFVIVSDWPSPVEGYLEAQDGAKAWVINKCSASSKLQWASGYGNWSSSFGATPMASYGVGQILGQPTSSQFGDSRSSWCPTSINGRCVNRATPREALTTFYTEFIEARFAMPMYLTAVILVENYGGDRTSRVLVPSDRDPSKWKAIMTKDLAGTPAAASVKKYSVESLPVCQTLWPVDRIRLEFDTCHRDGWYEVDAVQVRGGIVDSANVLNTTTQLYFRALPTFTGTVTFGLTATSCLGSFDASSEPLSIAVQVRDTPYVLTVEVSDSWSAIDVGQLDSGPRAGDVLVLDMASLGALRYGGSLVNATLQDLGSAATTFEYRPFRCDAQLRDSFLVQLGLMAVVQVNVQGCTTVVSHLIAIVVPCVVVPIALGLLWWLWWRLNRHNRRDNSCAPKDPDQAICVLFTDIQASTTLWGEVPELMAPALDAHHALIRKQIKKYKCYEVKTIGDAFMVVSTQPRAALQLALGIQEALYDHDWEGDGLDAVYRTQTGCRLITGTYDRLWNGLRVRVGMHYGRAQITFDETTKGYDYYGTVVNAAARIEGAAHGGQVVLSREAFDQVAPYCDGHGVAVQRLGAAHLRGLPAALDLVQVLPARFADRVFPALRLDHADPVAEDLEEMHSDHVPSAAGSGLFRLQVYPQAIDREVLLHPMVRSGLIAAESAASLTYHLYYGMKSQLNMHKRPEVRRKRLEELCQQWHVACATDTDLHENTTVGKLAMQLMGSVVSQMNAKPRAHSGSQIFNDLPVASPATGSHHAVNRIVPLSASVGALSHNLYTAVSRKKYGLQVDEPQDAATASLGRLSIPIVDNEPVGHEGQREHLKSVDLPQTVPAHSASVLPSA